MARVMKKRWFRRVCLVTCLTVGLLGGCGKKQTDGINWAAEYEKVYYMYQDEVNSKTGAGITCQPSGTGYFVMNTDNFLLVFPSQFGFPNALTGVPGYDVTFNDGNCSVTPPSGWEVTAVNSALYVYNKDQMVQGQFMPGRVDSSAGDVADATILKNYIESWFKLVSTEYSFHDIYLGDSSKQGISGHCVANVEGGQTVVINCGMVSDGKNTMTYLFTYMGAENQAKESTIQGIVSACKIGGKLLKVM